MPQQWTPPIDAVAQEEPKQPSWKPPVDAKEKKKSGGTPSNVPSQLSGEGGLSDNMKALMATATVGKPEQPAYEIYQPKTVASSTAVAKPFDITEGYGPEADLLEVQRQKAINRADVAQERVKNALNNTIDRRLTQNGIKYKVGDSNWKAEYDYLRARLKEGDFDIYKEGNKPFIGRVGTPYEAMVKAFKDSEARENEGAAIVQMNDKDAASLLESKRNQLQEALPTISDKSVLGYVGENLGANAKLIGKGIAGGLLGAGLETLTGGAATPALPAFMSFLFMSPDLAQSGYYNSLEKRYNELRNQNVAPEEAYRQSKSNAYLGEAKELALGALLSKVPNMPPTENVGKALYQSFKQIGKTGVQAGGLEAAKGLAEYAKGDNKDAAQILKEAWDSGTELSKIGLMFWVLHNPMTVPKYVYAQVKESLSKLPTEVINEMNSKAIQSGYITPQMADESVRQLQSYQQAQKKVPQGLDAETNGVVTGLIEKRTKLEKAKSEIDPTFYEDYDKQINAINQKIKEAKNGDNPLRVETDDVTGQPLSEKPETKNKAEELLKDLKPKKDEQGNPIITDIDVSIAKQDPEGFMMELADQALGRTRKPDGTTEIHPLGGKEKKLRDKYGDKIVNAAIDMFPLEEKQTETKIEEPSKISVIKPEEVTKPNVVEPIKREDSGKIETDNAVMEGVKTDYIENPEGEKIKLPENGYLIDAVYLKQGKEKGKGSGQELYKKALDEHGVLYSHWPISDDAMRVQNKLQEKGIAKIENIKLPDGTELIKITKTKQPQPTITEEGVTPLPIEPTKETVGGGGAREMTGVTHAETDATAKEFGFDTYEANPEKVADWDAEARKRIEENPKAIPDLMKKMEDGQMPSDVEQRMMSMYMADLKAKIRETPTDELLSKYKYAKDLSDIVGGREVGKSLRARQELLPVEETLPDWYVQAMEANGVDKLTPEQKADVEQRFADYEAKLKISEEKNKEWEETVAKLKAENEFLKQKKSVKKSGARDYKKERDEILSSIKEKLKKSREQSQATIVPYAKELIEIAPDVAKLAKNLIEEGYEKLSDVVKEIHGRLKEDIPDITEKDVHDIIAGDYNVKKPTKSELQRKYKDLQDEAKLINKLDALVNGEEPKELKQRIERNQRIKDLKQQIKDFQKEKAEGEKFYTEQTDEDSRKLNAIKKRNEAETKKIKEKIEKGDFSEEPKKTPITENDLVKKKYPKLWNEVMDARHAKEEAYADWMLKKHQDELKRESLFKKGLRTVSNAISTSKAIVAGVDDSITFVQLFPAIMANKRMALKAKLEALQDINVKRYRRQLSALHHAPDWQLIKDSGLDIIEPKSLTKEKLEELYSGNLFNQDFKVRNKTINPWTWTGGIFERLFTSMGNNMRLMMFRKRAQQLIDKGYTFKDHPQEFKDAARVINEMTGRGKLSPIVEQATPLISPFIWAPKMLASTFNTLGITDAAFGSVGKKGYYASLTPAERSFATKQMGKAIGTGIMVMAVLGYAGWQVDYDPRSTTFGTVKKGTTSYNVFGRYAGIVKLLVQGITGEKVTKTGIKDLDSEKFGAETRGTVAGKFIRGKLTPAAGLTYDYLFNAKRNSFTRQRIDGKDIVEELTIPLSARDLKNGLEQDGALSLLTRYLPSLEGIQVTDERDFEANKEKKEKKEKPEKKPKPVKQ